MSLRMKKARKRKGFTLIEMVIVITIIGMLSSIAVTKYSKVQENAKLNADYATAANLATAAQMALNDGGNVDVTNLTALETAGYIEFVPKVKSGNKEKFAIVKGDNDSITVTGGGNDLYPKPDGIESKPEE